jgi:cbb3-type cytochrome oxidase maturation protein
MSVIYLVLPIAIFLAGAFVAAFIWATRSGQYDDMDSPAKRMLNDDEPHHDS